MAFVVDSARAFSANSVSLIATAGAGEDISFADIALQISDLLKTATQNTVAGTNTTQLNGESQFVANARAAGITGPAVFQFPASVDLTSAAAVKTAAIAASPLIAFLYSTKNAAGTTISTAAITQEFLADYGVSLQLITDAITSPALQVIAPVANSASFDAVAAGATVALTADLIRISRAAAIAS
jgi:hypothetical protein